MICNPVPDVLMKTPLNARQGIATQSNLTPYVLTNTNRTNVHNNNKNRNELLLSATTTTTTSANANTGATPTLSATGATLNSLKSPFMNYQHNMSNSNSANNSNSKSISYA